MLVYLCHFSTGKYIGNLILINDGIQDCVALFTDLTPALCACNEKILNIMRTLLAWNGFLAQDQKPVLREILAILAKAVRKIAKKMGSPVN